MPKDILPAIIVQEVKATNSLTDLGSPVLQRLKPDQIVEALSLITPGKPVVKKEKRIGFRTISAQEKRDFYNEYGYSIPE